MKDIEIRIKELEDELKELREEVEMQKKQEEPKPWKPEVGKEYFYIDNILKTGKYFNGDDFIDDRLITVGNCFPTKKRAEQVAEKVRLLLRMEQLHDMLCPDYVPNWEDDRLKYYVYFDHERGNWNITAVSFCDVPNSVFFETRENAIKAAKILNRELKLELNEK